MNDLFKPTFLRMGVPLNKSRPPTSIQPPTATGGPPTLSDVETYDNESAAGTTHPWTLPSSVQIGDEVAAFLSFQDTDLDTPPSGWTLIESQTTASSGGVRHYIYGKVITSSDQLNDTFTSTTDGEIACTWVRIAANGNTRSVANWESDSTVGPPIDSPSVSVPEAGNYISLTGLLANKGTLVADPTGYTTLSNHQTSNAGVNGPRVYIASALKALTTAEDPDATNWSSTAGDRFFMNYTLLIPAFDADPELPGFDHTHEIADLVDADTLSAGDVFYSSDGTNVTRLAIGTAGQVLKVNSGATAPEWGTDLTGGGSSSQSFVTDPGMRPPDSADGGDVEFQGQTNGTNPATSLFSWGNQGSATGNIINGFLVMNSATTTGLRALLKATPGAGNFDVSTMFRSMQYQNTHAAGIVLLWGTPGTPTAIRVCGRYYNTGVGTRTRFVTTTYNTSWAATADNGTLDVPMGTEPAFIRVAWDGTNIVVTNSTNGVEGTYVQSYSAALGLGRPDYVGLGVNNNGAAAASIAAFSYLRFNWTADFDPTTDN